MAKKMTPMGRDWSRLNVYKIRYNKELVKSHGGFNGGLHSSRMNDEMRNKMATIDDYHSNLLDAISISNRWIFCQWCLGNDYLSSWFFTSRPQSFRSSPGLIKLTKLTKFTFFHFADESEWIVLTTSNNANFSEQCTNCDKHIIHCHSNHNQCLWKNVANMRRQCYLYYFIAIEMSIVFSVS